MTCSHQDYKLRSPLGKLAANLAHPSADVEILDLQILAHFQNEIFRQGKKRGNDGWIAANNFGRDIECPEFYFPDRDRKPLYKIRSSNGVTYYLSTEGPDLKFNGFAKSVMEVEAKSRQLEKDMPEAF